MAAVRRYYTQFPGLSTLTEIEQVAVVDEPPASAPLGAGTGVLLLVAEFEDGPFEAPTRVFGGVDQETQFGALGWTDEYGAPYRYAVASRSAGSATYWNGNGWVDLQSKRHAGLILCRVDGSAGSVQFSRLAALTGGVAPFDLEPAQTLVLSADGGAVDTVTFSAAAAQLDGVSGTFPTTFTGGETLELSIDGAPTQIVTFQAADQTIAQVVARVNSSVAQTIASNNAGQLRLSSTQRGWGGSIEVVGGTARATLGLPTAATSQVLTYTVTTADDGLWTAAFDQTIDGVTTTYSAEYTADGADTETIIRNALLADYQAQTIPYATFSASSTNLMLVTMDANREASNPVEANGTAGVGTFAITTPIVRTLARGTGNVENIDFVQHAEVASLVTTASADYVVDLDSTGHTRIANIATPGTGTLEATVASTATGLGFDLGTEAQAGVGGEAGSIPAGTLLRDSTTDAVWITMETVATLATGSGAGGPYDVRVRPAVDDDTCPTAAIGDLEIVLSTLYHPFAVTNAAALSRLSGPQMEARYQRAIDATLDIAGVAFDANQIRSSRHTATINRAIYLNALSATASGHRARKPVLSPPIGTTRAVARGATGVGVGVSRDQRCFYAFPGMRVLIPRMAEVGSAAGSGFSDDGVVQLPSDGWYASVRSVLAPEENAGQNLSDTNYGPLQALGLENAYDRSLGGTGLVEADYIAFKAAGIIAPTVTRQGLAFQSDVTAVDPSITPALADAKRRYFTDFLSDSLLDIGVLYSGKLNTPRRRTGLLATVNTFLDLLQSPSQPDSSRLLAFSVKDVTTETQRGLGLQITQVKVQQHSSLDSIVFRLTSGTTVQVEED